MNKAPSESSVHCTVLSVIRQAVTMATTARQAQVRSEGKQPNTYSVVWIFRLLISCLPSTSCLCLCSCSPVVLRLCVRLSVFHVCSPLRCCSCVSVVCWEGFFCSLVLLFLFSHESSLLLLMKHTFVLNLPALVSWILFAKLLTVCRVWTGLGYYGLCFWLQGHDSLSDLHSLLFSSRLKSTHGNFTLVSLNNIRGSCENAWPDSPPLPPVASYFRSVVLEPRVCWWC